MSDFFGGLTGGNIRFTDARINGDGPLPTTLSGPEGINGDPDGKYNFNDSLLSGITPYAYGQGRMGSDRNYQQIPNRKQFPVPPLWLPEPDPKTDTLFEVSHSIDMGDVAFIVNAHHKQFLLSRGPFKHESQNEDHTLPQWNVFCNVCTINYLLAGLYNYALHYATGPWGNEKLNHAWFRLFKCFKIDKHLEHIKEKFEAENASRHKYSYDTLRLRCFLMLHQVIKQYMIPIGICSMSEKQGGQHEIGSKPVQAACNFFTTLTVDGQNRDLVNIWRAATVEAGDFLIIRPEFCSSATKNCCKYTYVLNHYYKDTVTRSINMHEHAHGRIQLVPDVFKMNNSVKMNNSREEPGTPRLIESKDHFTAFLADKSFFVACSDKLYDFATNARYYGYWHIGQSYNKKLEFANTRVPCNDMEMTKGQLLQINFAPVWKGSTYRPTQLTEQNLAHFHAYALQHLMFGDLDYFIDVGVSENRPAQGPVVVPQAVIGTEITKITDSTLPQQKFRSTRTEPPILPVSLDANAAMQTQDARTTDAKSEVPATEQLSAWDFETEIDNIFAADAKPKKQKTKNVAP
jgi:hypothetical protein